jgi:hypothetical protein
VYGGKLYVLVGLTLVFAGTSCGGGADRKAIGCERMTITVHIEGFKKSESGAT